MIKALKVCFRWAWNCISSEYPATRRAIYTGSREEEWEWIICASNWRQ